MRHLIVVAFCFLISISGFAQVQFDEVAKVSYRFQLANVNGKVNDSLFLSTHASQIAKPDTSLSVVMVFELISRVNPAGSRASLASVYFQFLGWEGDGQYQGVPFSIQLLPSTFSFQMEVVDLQNRSLFKEVISKSSLTAKGFLADVSIPFAFQSSSHSIRISKLSFGFGADILDKYRDFISNVSEYQLLDEDLRISKDLLNEMRLNNLEQLPGNKKVLDEMLVFVNEANQSPLIKDLGLREYDPLTILQRLSTLKEEVLAKRKLVYQQMNGLDIRLFNEGVRNALAQNLDSARYFYQLSKAINPNFLPAEVELAYLEFSEGNISGARKQFQSIAFRDRPDPESMIRYKKLGEELLQAQWEIAKREISNSRYEEAQDWLKKTEELVQKNTFLMAPDSLLYLQKRSSKEAYQFTYQEFIDKVNSGSYELAHVQLQQLRARYYTLHYEFAATNTSDVSEDALVKLGNGLEEISLKAENSNSLALAFQLAIQARKYPGQLQPRKELLNQVLKNRLTRVDTLDLILSVDDFVNRALQAGMKISIPSQVSQLCGALTPYFDSLTLAYELFDKSEYVTGYKILSSAANRLKAKGNCGMVINGAEERIETYQKISRYQEFVNSARMAEQAKDLVVFFNKYAEAEYQFLLNKLYLNGISHKPLFLHAMDGKADLKYEAALFYTATDQYDKAIELIMDSTMRLERAKQVRDLEDILAEKMVRWIKAEKPYQTFQAVEIAYELSRPTLKYLFKQFIKYRNAP